MSAGLEVHEYEFNGPPYLGSTARLPIGFHNPAARKRGLSPRHTRAVSERIARPAP